jgi:hypothetical protein
MGFELDVHVLEERLLTQMLFAESYLEDSFLVFNQYNKEVTNHRLVQAFLSCYGYKYLLHDHVIHPELFPLMKRELNYVENDIYLLAWLKHNVTNKNLTDNDKIFIEYNLQRLVKKGIVLPFFADYRRFVTVPDGILDKCFLTYNTDPQKQVFLHYRLLNQEEQDYITERMPNVFMGIHMKSFMLFYHETLQYYITEESAEAVTITESLHTQYECETPDDDESKYNQINLMLMALEMKDENTLLDLMENYITKEYMIATCFKQINS